jgi:hypothetical protein
MTTDRLGIGFVGSGFNARFHVQSLTSVREIDVRGVWSPNEKNAASMAALARELDVGEARPYKSIRDMVADPAINALRRRLRKNQLACLLLAQGLPLLLDARNGMVGDRRAHAHPVSPVKGEARTGLRLDADPMTNRPTRASRDPAAHEIAGPTTRHGIGAVQPPST